MLILATDFWDILANPFVVSALTFLIAYVGNRAYQSAVTNKTHIEGVVLTADKVDELSSTILTLRNALGDAATENNKLSRAMDNIKEDCDELKTCVKEFLEASEEIHRNAGDAIIQRQIEGLRKKMSE